MFSNISWGMYFGTTLSIASAYYIAIGLIYYKDEIRRFFFSSKFRYISANQVKTSSAGISKNSEQAGAETTAQYNNVYEAAEILNSDIIAVINTAARNSLIREELITAIQLQIKKYQELKGTAFQVAINNSVQKECESQCSICLDENELKVLWLE